MKYFNIIKITLSNLIVQVKKSPNLAFQEIWQYYILGKILGKKNAYIYIGSSKILGPNTLAFYYTLNELFVDKLYKNLIGLKNVLDLGGFVGESAIFFAKNNNYVEVYEADPDNYLYIKKNIKNYSNIKGFNYAVVSNDEPYIFYTKFISNDPGGRINNENLENSIKISSINILKILENKKFDGLKMDIEGAEYDICDVLIKSQIFPFEKGYIEFHNFIGEEKKISTIKNLISFLNEINYFVEYENIFGKKISFNDAIKDKNNIFVIYFQKK